MLLPLPLVPLDPVIGIAFNVEALQSRRITNCSVCRSGQRGWGMSESQVLQEGIEKVDSAHPRKGTTKWWCKREEKSKSD